MLINSSFASFRIRPNASLFFVVTCHFLIVVFFLRSVRLQSIVPAYEMMSVFSVRQNANEKLKAPIEKEDTKIARRFDEPKNATQKTTDDEPSKVIDPINSEEFSTEKAKGEGQSLAGKELASLDSLGRRYNLDIPKSPLVETLTPAQQAAQDPRTNSARLTKSEKFAAVLGSLDCIFQTRLADGKIIRVPGQWVEMPARAEPGRVSIRTVRFCVRVHQVEGEEGKDLTAIIAGLRGK